MRRAAWFAAGLAATLVLSLSVVATGATWEWPEWEPEGQVREISQRFTFDGGPAVRVICEVTLVKSIHELIEKTQGALWGTVIAARAANCRSNRGSAAGADFQLNLPWHMTYESFQGTLPQITEILVIARRASVLLTIAGPLGGARCLYTGDVPLAKRGRTQNGHLEIQTLATLDGNSSPLAAALGQEVLVQCPVRVEWRGTFALNRTVRITRF